MNMIHFIRPYCLYALLPAMLYLGWIIVKSPLSNPWVKVCDPHLLPTLLKSNRSTSSLLSHIILFLFVIIAIFALAGPSWKKITLPVYRSLTSTIIVLDLSANMQETDIKPDRITRAKLKIRDIINESHHAQLGLVVFSGEAFVVMPLSQDAKTLDVMLEELTPAIMPVTGSEMGTGLDQALTLFKQTNVQQGHIIILTASDTSDNSWIVANKIKAAGHRLDVLAMLESNVANESIIDHLKQMANSANGSFYLFTPDILDVKSILENRTSSATVNDQNIDKATLWYDAGPWFCLLLIPLALLLLREKAL